MKSVPTIADVLSPAELARLHRHIEWLMKVHALTFVRIADLIGEPQDAVARLTAGAATPSRSFAAKIERLTLDMTHNSLAAWKHRVSASAGYEMLIDRELTILAVNGGAPGIRQRGTQGQLDPSLFIGRKYNSILPSLDCALIETHGNGFDDLLTIGFFDGRIHCVRFCAEINSGIVTRVGVREIWPVETVDAGIVAHVILYDDNEIPRTLTKPGIRVHWREVIPARSA